ncbi:MAG TPA: hypothetical protein VNA27_15220 [Rubrobacteraceae bacterium]|nr:hypothetical protein [Rubrobacteraceae bacterium]
MAVMLVALIVVFTASCGGESTTPQGDESSGTPYSPSATATSLQEAGWHVLDQEESPGTYADVTEVGYLETEAPDGEPIGLQFLESPAEAQLELDATVEEESPFDGTTDGNVLIFGLESESAEVTPENLEALQGILK